MKWRHWIAEKVLRVPAEILYLDVSEWRYKCGPTSITTEICGREMTQEEWLKRGLLPHSKPTDDPPKKG